MRDGENVRGLKGCTRVGLRVVEIVRGLELDPTFSFQVSHAQPRRNEN